MASTDGRDTRWAEHRLTRRRELVEDALRAIRKYGAGVGMDEIAAQAGTSKTVIYRHFGDRASVHDFIHHGLSAALELTDPHDLSELARDLADAYLGLVERDPEIYRFVLSPPSPDAAASVDPLGGLPELIGDHVSTAIAQHLARSGQDPACAPTWGHGLVGFIRAAADRWIAAEQREPREAVVDHIDAFFTPALASGLAAVPQLQEQP
ncbi:MAG: TetR/AcrR family transcriptional regulator [Gammaproteobacteria bacterium]|nr:TetR/AcrR family transcriptional regulator [Gammaproteobacteria bacterium]